MKEVFHENENQFLPSGMDLGPVTLRVRCPHCRKLYMVHQADIRESQPRFECVQCHSRFWLAMADVDAKSEIIGLPLHTRSLAASKRAEVREKSGPRQLTNAWQKVVDHYEDSSAHDHFIKLAFRDKALVFASEKYNEMLKLMPMDEVAVKRLQEIQALGLAVLPEAEPVKLQRLQFRPALMGIGALMVVVGLMSPFLRNVVGVGAVIFFVAVVLQIQQGPNR